MAITSLREKYIAEIKQVYYMKRGIGAEIARQSGLATGDLAQILNGKRKHSLEMLIRIKEAAKKVKKRES